MRSAFLFALLVALQFSALGVLAESIEQPLHQKQVQAKPLAHSPRTREPASLKSPEIVREPLSASEQMLKFQRTPLPRAPRSKHAPYYAGLCRDSKGAQYDLAQNQTGYSECLEDERHQGGLAVIFPFKR